MTMRVLYVINGLGAGGAERSLAEMLPRLADRGVDPLVVCLDHRQEGVEGTVRALGVDVQFLPGTRIASRAVKLRGIIRAERPDLIHTTLFESNVAGRLASMGVRIPLLTSLVNTPYEQVRLKDPNISARALRSVRVVDGWTSRHFTAHFHAITNAVKMAAVRDLGVPAERITVVERGRDPARLGVGSPERRRRSRQALDLSDDDWVIITAGRQEYQKGQVFLIEAVRILLGHHPRIVLLVAGRAGHATSDLRRAGSALESSGRLRFLGHRDDLPEVLAAGDVFAFPSLFEGLGGSVIEAMALGLPVVASDIPALREVLEEGRNAQLVASGSAEALAFALQGLLDDPERMRRFGRRSRERFEERFTIDRSTSRMVALYRRILDSQPAGTGAV